MTEGRLISLVSEDLLQDYVDGRLEPQMESRVERIIFGDPDLRARTLEYYALNHRLKKSFAHLGGGELPPTLQNLADELEGCLKKRERRPSGVSGFPVAALTRVAAVCVLVVGGVLATSQYWRELPVEGINVAKLTSLSSDGATQDDASATTVAVSPERETGPSATPELSPSFQGFGFELIETRILDPMETGAVQLVYESSKGKRILLYYSDQVDPQKTQVTVRQEGPLAMLFWQADGRSFTLLGEVDQTTLLTLGQHVSEGLAVDGALKKNQSGTVVQPKSEQVRQKMKNEIPVPAKTAPEPVKDSDAI